MPRRLLIVNADDFGLSEGVNRGIAEAHEEGIVTSASLMVRGEAVQAAVEYARRRPQLDVGIHIDLAEWTCAKGEWQSLYEVVSLDDTGAVEAEVDRQMHEFVRLMGCAPTHIDSHQHLHRGGPVRAAAMRHARRLGVPLRHFCAGIGHCGDYYGQTGEGEPLPERLSVRSLALTIAGLTSDVTELACHPGYAENLPTMYRSERALEVAALCDPRARAAIAAARITLTRFSELPSAVRRELPS